MKVLIILVTTLNLINFSSSDSFCYSRSQKNLCLNTELNSNDKQCCYFEDATCMEIKNDQYILGSNSIIKAFYRELVGFYIMKDDIEYFNAECKNGNISWTNEDVNFSIDEEKIFGSENYCLNYHQKVVNGQTTIKSKETCLKAKVLEYSKNFGIECGYYEVTVKTDGYGEKKVSTCYFLNTNNMKDLNNSTTVDDVTNYILYYLMQGISPDNKYLSYSLNIASSGGKELYYDSITGKMSVKEYSKKIYFSKFIYLLILCLF